MLEFDPLGLISTLLSLTVGTLIGSEFSRFFYRPRVKVRYKELDPNYDSGGVYWSFQIENLGRTMAEKCLANITIPELSSDHILEPSDASLDEGLPQYEQENIDLSTPRQQILSKSHFRELRRTSLCWSKLGNPEELDINPGVSQSVDVCKFQNTEEGGYFIFPSEAGWRKVRVRLRKKVLSGYVLVCPANEFPTRVDFKITITTDGSSNMKIMKPSIWRRLLRTRSYP